MSSDAKPTFREVMQLRQTVHRLDALVTQLERALDPPERRAERCLVGEALQRENERLLALLRAHPPPRPVMLPHRRCQICGELLPESFHADHIVPFATLFDDSDANIQIICASPCHVEKTSLEASGRRRAHAVVCDEGA